MNKYFISSLSSKLYNINNNPSCKLRVLDTNMPTVYTAVF